MNASTVPDNPTPAAVQSSTLAQQFRIAAAMLCAMMLFWNIGWLVAAPADPQGPMLFLNITGGIAKYPLLLGLSGVAAVLAILIAGTHATTIGPMAVAFGLIALRWRGGGAELIGGYYTGDDPAAMTWPTVALLLDFAAWMSMIAAGWYIASLAAGRLCPRDAGETPVAVRGNNNAYLEQVTETMIAAIIAYVLITLLGGSSEQPVNKQQVAFSVAAAFFGGAAAAHLPLKSRTNVWMLPAVGLVAVLAIFFGNPLADGVPQNIAVRMLADNAARVLPIEFAAWGTIGALGGAAIMAARISANSSSDHAKNSDA